MLSLEDQIRNGGVVVLDGATGTELQRRGAPMDRAAWCAAATLTHPELLVQLHEDYIRAGADIVFMQLPKQLGMGQGCRRAPGRAVHRRTAALQLGTCRAIEHHDAAGAYPLFERKHPVLP